MELDLPVNRADTRYFQLNYRNENGDTWCLISDVTVENGVTKVTLRTPVQVSTYKII